MAQMIAIAIVRDLGVVAVLGPRRILAKHTSFCAALTLRSALHFTPELGRLFFRLDPHTLLERQLVRVELLHSGHQRLRTTLHGDAVLQAISRAH
ncbi:hypothetical protein LMG28138_04238 [Pararobbsia alpina]|uniref:Uncharacterized protein n=1 Tax=Pararobbsia alpina TaxID=621374 RepID=A0A6S7D6G7_9BURK|nr:hypothetical protein LMG28138_04238 [Pararobbsia alpina]